MGVSMFSFVLNHSMSISSAKQRSLSQALAMHMQRSISEIKEENLAGLKGGITANRGLFSA